MARHSLVLVIIAMCSLDGIGCSRNSRPPVESGGTDTGTGGAPGSTTTSVGTTGGSTTGGPTNVDPMASMGTRLIRLTAIRSQASWAPVSQTPAQVLQLLTQLRTALGTPFGLYGFIEGEQDPNAVVPGSTLTVNQYLTQAQQAAGGPVIPGLNLDNFSPPVGGHPYACADGNSGPPCFWKISQDLLTLDAIASGPRIALVGSWETLNRCTADPNYCMQTKTVLQEILAHGWAAIIPGDIGPFFSDQGVAAGVEIGVTFKEAPGMLADPNLLSQAHAEASNPRAFVDINAQSQHCPQQSAMDHFLADLTPAQKSASFLAIAQGQKDGAYTFVYPMWNFGNNPNIDTCNAANANPGYWDATTSLQADNTPFFDLLVSLMKQYN